VEHLVKLHTTDPLTDHRWDELVASHPNASAFQERGWVEALVRTYGYEPFVLTSSPPGEALTDGILLCRVASWLTGARAVSLPFADHCQPLLNQGRGEKEFASWLQQRCRSDGWKYVELRPLSWSETADHALPPGRSFGYHVLDLTPTLDEIFRGFHKSSMQRRIRRAEKEGLSYEVGSGELLEPFYRLLLITRRRHRLVPQPRAWFRNLLECMGDKAQIRVARKDGIPIAAIFTLRHRSTVMYKYGCSDETFHNLAAMPFLFWKLIVDSKQWGATNLDLGRSDLDQPGLIAFKDHLGARQKQITYFRYPEESQRGAAQASSVRAMRRLVSCLPDAALSMAGNALYRHVG
jgi:CelD/BcsL family acetyltransferase involved in cellulose biosynthesis